LKKTIESQELLIIAVKKKTKVVKAMSFNRMSVTKNGAIRLSLVRLQCLGVLKH